MTNRKQQLVSPSWDCLWWVSCWRWPVWCSLSGTHPHRVPGGAKPITKLPPAKTVAEVRSIFDKGGHDYYQAPSLAGPGSGQRGQQGGVAYRRDIHLGSPAYLLMRYTRPIK
jgi:hypothetical protein